MKDEKKAGVVALVGRPNVGKSTLLNTLLKTKVSITSPRPQTTRFAIEALYEDDRGQILFIDTPGIFAKIEDPLAKKINMASEKAFTNNVDAAVYMIDHTRSRETEENKVLGMVRKLNVPKILVFNKSDIKKPSFKEQYLFLEDEFDHIVELSALTKHNLNLLLEALFEILPKGKPFTDLSRLPTPLLNSNSKTFISELIREKAFLNLRKELPYSLTTVVDEISERDNGTLFIKGRIITNNDRYKGMIIGTRGKMIKEIGMAVRKELEVSTDKKAFIDLSVEVNPHWEEGF